MGYFKQFYNPYTVPIKAEAEEELITEAKRRREEMRRINAEAKYNWEALHREREERRQLEEAKQREWRKLQQRRKEEEQKRQEFERRFRAWVYFIQRPDTNLIKIGFTTRIFLLDRFDELRYKYHKDLRFLGAYECESKREKVLHKIYSEFRVEGEWFEPSKPILYFIKTVCAPYVAIGSHWWPKIADSF